MQKDCQPTRPSQLEIQQQNICSKGCHEAQCLGPIGCFTDDLEVLLRRQDQAEPCPEEGRFDSDVHGDRRHEILKRSVKQ
jgi:hypothetical protein